MAILAPKRSFPKARAHSPATTLAFAFLTIIYFFSQPATAQQDNEGIAIPSLSPEEQAVCGPCYEQFDACGHNCTNQLWIVGFTEAAKTKCAVLDKNGNSLLDACYQQAGEKHASCLGECAGYDWCESKCADDLAQDRADCEGKFMATCVGECNQLCEQKFAECIKNKTCQQGSCSVAIRKELDGVSADGVSQISFTLAADGEYSDYGIKLEGSPRGEVKEEGKKISFIPASADSAKNYLAPQEVAVIGTCTPKDGGKIKEAKEKFFIVQPPLFFVHGILSSSAAWATFEKRAKQDGFYFDDISYPNTGPIEESAVQLEQELGGFLEKIKSGASFGGKRINASKIDVVAHSMGGLVTRYYISNYYDDDKNQHPKNIRKLVMLGTPNHGAWDAKLTPAIVPRSILGEAGIQLRPDGEFLKKLNSIPNNPSIEYQTIAGTGWGTDQEGLSFTSNGDGIVLVDSVKLAGAPIYCTYDAHSAELYFGARANYTAYHNNKGGTFSSDGGTLATSQAAYDIAKSAILTGTAKGIECGQDNAAQGAAGEPKKTYIMQARSPVTLHAFDEQGRHAGMTSQGVFENQIGDAVYYSNGTQTIHQMMKVISSKNIKFEATGNAQGTFGLDFIRFDADNTIATKTFNNLATSPNLRHTLNAWENDPSLAQEEAKEAAQPAPETPLSAIAIGLLVLAILGAIAFFATKRQAKK